jgi:hypothetical protein
MSDIDPKFQDIRLAQRAMKRGHLSPKAYEKYVKTVPDSAENAVAVEAEMEPVELEEPGTKKRRGKRSDDGE